MAKKRRRKPIDPSQLQRVKGEYFGMEEVDIELVDNFVVQHNLDGFYLSFFRTQHPIAITPEEQANITKIPLKCVKRIFVTPRGLDMIIEALEINREKFRNTYGIEEIEEFDIETEDSQLTQSEDTTPESSIE